MKLSNLCQSGSFLRALYFFRNVLKIIFIVVPIIIVITVIVNLAKIVISGKEEDFKAALGVSVKKLIAGLVIFLMPTIASYVFSLTGESFEDLKVCMEKCNGKQN